MRRTHHNQLRLVPGPLTHPHAQEMDAIADILDRHPTIAELANTRPGGARRRPGPGAPPTIETPKRRPGA